MPLESTNNIWFVIRRRWVESKRNLLGGFAISSAHILPAPRCTLFFSLSAASMSSYVLIKILCLAIFPS